MHAFGALTIGMTMALTDLDSYLERFYEAYIDPDNAGMPRDSEGDDGYFWTAPKYSTEDAVAELFDQELTEVEMEELAKDLNQSYSDWAKRSEL